MAQASPGATELTEDMFWFAGPTPAKAQRTNLFALPWLKVALRRCGMVQDAAHHRFLMQGGRLCPLPLDMTTIFSRLVALHACTCPH